MTNKLHKSMKHFTVITFLLCLSSCLLDNFGYPRRITFDKEGGTAIVQRVGGTLSIDICDYNGNIFASIDDNNKYDEPIIAEYRWLTVELSESEIKITVLPNDTRRKRKLYLDIMVGNIRSTIDITQR